MATVRTCLIVPGRADAIRAPAARGAVVAGVLAAACGGFVAAAAEDAAPAADAAQITAWIEQLAAEQFSQREAASRSLVGVGAAAIGPLREAIGRGDLEVCSRGVDILREWLAGEDAAVAAAAEQALEGLAEGDDPAVASMAEATLDVHTASMVEAAREKLAGLGAIITDGFSVSGRRGPQIVLNNGWKGTSEDLRLLARLRDITHVGVHGIRLDDASVAVLGRLRGVEHLQLFGTGIDETTVAVLALKLPETKIDVRRGGKLGVAGQSAIGPCVLHHVQEGSAAAQAGIMIGDIVLRIDGRPVANFEALTDLVSRHGPGEKIELDIERGAGIPGIEPERFKRTVELGGWE